MTTNNLRLERHGAEGEPRTGRVTPHETPRQSGYSLSRRCLRAYRRDAGQDPDLPPWAFRTNDERRLPLVFAVVALGHRWLVISVPEAWR